jgi:hypothetical protein
MWTNAVLFKSRVIIVTLLGTLSLLSGQLFASSPNQKPSVSPCSRRNLDQVAVVGQFIFRTYQQRPDGNACLQVFRGGMVIYRHVKDVERFSLGQPAQPDYHVPFIANGTDITGRGHPDMIVTNWSGGAHCCYELLLFKLEPKFQLLTTLNLGDSDLAHFERDPRNGKYYFHGYDEAFVYWHTSFAESPMPSVTLQWGEDGSGQEDYRIALDEMKKPQPGKLEWEADFMQEAREAFEPNAAFEDMPGKPYLAGSELWKPMLELIYTGRSPLAWKLVDQAWPVDKPNKDKFLSDFCAQLSQSKYWVDIRPTIEDAPAQCSRAFLQADKTTKQ